MNNVIYHPSGQFLVGINCYYDSNRIIQMIKPFKFELASKNLVFGLDLIGKCVDPQYFTIWPNGTSSLIRMLNGKQ